ncbi:MAG: class I SAM-dependent methyltransferase, partial [Candidatus Syntropharchaeales archaeon]
EFKERFSSLNEAIEEWKENLGVSSPEAEEVIRTYLSANLVEEDGAFYLKNEIKSAMIWWKKTDG